MKYFITLSLISILSLSCLTSKNYSYKMTGVYYNDTDYYTTFYNFENIKQPSKRITLYTDSGQYKVGDVIYFKDKK
jgi:hypothetical protein